MAGTVSPRLSLAAYVDYLQNSYQLTDMEMAHLLTKLASHYLMKDTKYGYDQDAPDDKVASTKST